MCSYSFYILELFEFKWDEKTYLKVDDIYNKQKVTFFMPSI